MGFTPDPFYTVDWPAGSIFWGFEEGDEEKERARRALKRPNGTDYFSRAEFFADLQARRCAKVENELAGNLRRKGERELEGEKAERVRKAQALFLRVVLGGVAANFGAWKEVCKRNKRIKRWLIMRMNQKGRSIFFAWADYAVRMGRAKRLLSKHVVDGARKVFLGWKGHVFKARRIMKLMRGALASLQDRTFKRWAGYVKKTLFVRRKIGKHMAGAKFEKFARWKDYAQKSGRVKRLMRRMLGGLKVKTFWRWKTWAQKSGRVRRIFAGKMMGSKRSMFKTWVASSAAWKAERLEREKWESATKPGDFFFLDGWGDPDHFNVPSLPRSYKAPPGKFKVY